MEVLGIFLPVSSGGVGLGSQRHSVTLADAARPAPLNHGMYNQLAKVSWVSAPLARRS